MGRRERGVAVKRLFSSRPKTGGKSCTSMEPPRSNGNLEYGTPLIFPSENRHSNHMRGKTLWRSSIFVLSLNVVLPILLGGVIYLSWRKDSLYMFHWFKVLRLNDAIMLLRGTFTPVKNYLPEFVLYSLPDAAWVYALTFFMIWLWKDEAKMKLIFWGSIGVVLGIGGEFGQMFGYVHGTFDFVDLLFCSIAAVSAAIIIEILENKNGEVC